MGVFRELQKHSFVGTQAPVPTTHQAEEVRFLPRANKWTSSDSPTKQGMDMCWKMDLHPSVNISNPFSWLVPDGLKPAVLGSLVSVCK